MQRNLKPHEEPSTITIPEHGELHHTKQRFESHVEHGDTPDGDDLTTPCWEWQAYTRNGYGQFWVQEKAHTAHRVAYQLYNGEIPSDTPLIHHECGNTTCVNPDHLRPTTIQENSRIAYENGNLELPTHEQAVKGGKNSPLDGPKISPETAVGIRKEYDRTDKTYDDLADEHDVKSSTIGRIIRGERPIDPPLNDTEPTGDGFTYLEADRVAFIEHTAPANQAHRERGQ